MLGEKVELQMITEEENAERTFLSMQSTSSDELVLADSSKGKKTKEWVP